MQETHAPEAIATEAPGPYASATMNAPDPDLELVRLAQSGDFRAFEALVVKYQRRVARHVTRYVKRPDDVEDVVQEAMLKAYRGLPSFRGDSSFYTWLYRIAMNAAINFVKRTPKNVVLKDDLSPNEDDEVVDTHGSDAEDPERLLLAKQISATIERALSRLHPDLAQALTLYEVEGLQYKEIAKMLRIPIGTVRTRIFRAREYIARKLDPVVGPVRDRRW
jgi:RNA polymerase sigma-70 factor, ECF subfamily